MTRRALVAGVILASLIALFATACSRGKPSTPSASQNDPALVPSSTPLQNPPLFEIVGDTITMQGGTPVTVQTGATTANTSTQTYTVVSGDTCSAIAAHFNVTLDALESANGGANGTCSTLAVGDIMHIPAPATPTPAGTSPSTGAGRNSTPTPTRSSSGGRTYTVQSGDTCYGIAQKLGVDPNTFVQANASACSSLQVGDTLTVP